MSESSPAPVALFVYNRPEHTRRTLESLAANALAGETTLHVYADGPKPGEDADAVAAVRALVRSRRWCREVHLHEAAANRGLAPSIVAGVTERLRESERVIVLEDDLELAPGFLKYMNDALERYAGEDRVMQITGYLPELPLELPETLFLRTTSSWGWATWRRAWASYQHDATSLAKAVRRARRVPEFNLDGSCDYMRQLELNAAGELRTWAVLWYASVFLREGLVLHPGRSLVRNIGNDGSGTNAAAADARFDLHGLAPGATVGAIPLEPHATARAAMRRRYQPPPGSWWQLPLEFRRAVGLNSPVLAAFAAFLDRARDRERARQCLRATSAVGAVFLPEARVLNLQEKPEAISIGSNSHIRGELLVFPYGGHIRLGTYCYVGEGSRIWSDTAVEIGDHVLISHQVMISDTDAHEMDAQERAAGFAKLVQQGHPRLRPNVRGARVAIGSHAWINPQVCILKGVTIGEGAIIGSGSVVTHDVPPFTLVAGNPAREIRQLSR